MKHAFFILAIFASATVLEAQAGPSADCSRIQQVAGGSERQMADDSASGATDFSAIDSREKAEELFRRGELEKVYLFPLDLGGPDIPENTTYVPAWAAVLKERVENAAVRALMEKGEVTQYAASTEYQGRSFVPIAITLVASDPGEFSCTINIWGEALARGEGA